MTDQVLDTTPDNTPSSIWKVGFLNGLLLGLVVIIMALALYLAGVSTQSGWQWLIYLIMAAVTFFLQKQYRDKQLGGYIRYGKALGLGVWMFVIAGVIAAIYTYVFMKWVDPSLMQEGLSQAYDDMKEQGMNEEQIEMGMKYAKMFTSPGIISIMALFSYPIMGLLFSLVTSAFVKKNDPNEFVA